MRLRPAPGAGAGAGQDDLDDVHHEARGLAEGPVADVLTWAGRLGDRAPRPGRGGTRRLWEVLAGVAAADLTVARVVEPHLDALAILDELAPGSAPAAGRTYGVWAAEGAEPRLEAVPGPDGTWSLTGRKPWCSLAGEVSHALLTAWVPAGGRGLFELDLSRPGTSVEPGTWSTRALSGVVTSTVALDRVPVRAVGGAGWYLERDGFAWGGAGVAAVWYGGAVGLARRMAEQPRRREPDQLALAHLGAVDAALSGARALLATTADDVDAGRAGGAAGALAAARVRQVVADAAEEVLRRCAHALGPGPLAHEEEHARRVADLGLYLRQHHAERDQAALGRLLLDGARAW